MDRKKLSHGNQNRRKKPAPARDDSVRHGHLPLARHAGADLSKGYFVQADTVPAALQQENRNDRREGEGFKGEETANAFSICGRWDEPRDRPKGWWLGT